MVEGIPPPPKGAREGPRLVAWVTASAALVQSVAWPATAVFAIIWLGGAIDLLARDMTSLEVAGVKLSRETVQSSLNPDQLKALKSLTVDDVVDFDSRYTGSDATSCLHDGVSSNYRKLVDAGLVTLVPGGADDPCARDGGAGLRLTAEGAKVREALHEVVRTVIRRSVFN